MNMVEAMEVWLRDTLPAHSGRDPLRAAINLMEHLTGTVSKESAAGFRDAVILRDRRLTRERNTVASREHMRELRLRAKQADIEIR